MTLVSLRAEKLSTSDHQKSIVLGNMYVRLDVDSKLLKYLNRSSGFPPSSVMPRSPHSHVISLPQTQYVSFVVKCTNLVAMRCS